MVCTLTPEKLPQLHVESLTLSYNGENIIENVSFSYSGSGIIQVIGPNGAGKSTLLRGLAGLIKPKNGRVTVNNKDITGKPFLASKFISFVPQMTLTERGITFPISARELLVFELKVSGYKLSKVEAEVRIEKVAKRVGLKDWELDIDLRSMSGGQKQKVFIARALIHDRPILLLDEPLSSIDPASRSEIADSILTLSENKLIIVTSHDPVPFMRSTKKMLLINRSLYFYGDPEEIMREEVLEKVYGSMLMKNGKHLHIFDDACSHIANKQ